jgi:hypothetical protein
LSHSGTGDEGFSVFAKAPKLTSLNMQGLAITDVGLAALTNSRALARLELAYCPVTRDGLHNLAGIPLRELGLAGTRIEFDDLPALVADFPELVSLDLRDIGGERGRGLAPLAELPSLAALSLDAQLAETEAENVGKIATLTSIGFAYQRTPISTEAIEALERIPQVSTIGFAASRFAPGVFDTFSRNTTIKNLGIHDCVVQDENLEKLSGMVALVKLSFRAAEVTDAGIRKFRELRPDVELTVDGKVYPATSPKSE